MSRVERSAAMRIRARELRHTALQLRGKQCSVYQATPQLRVVLGADA